MTNEPMIYYCGENALSEAITFCRRNQFQRFTLISDNNTHTVLGKQLVDLITAQGWTINPIILGEQEVVADERTLEEVLDRCGENPGVFLAVGSGTLTDITRYCSHKRDAVFISLPTAPSVDGFASSIAPIVIKGYKQSAPCRAPIAIFADIRTLCQAPKAMIAAGFGDMLGKYTALADWQLAHLIMDDPSQESIAARVEQAVQICVDNSAGISQMTPAGITGIMNGLVESGVCMALAGNSRPASGSEHHLSHYWEMLLLQQGRPAVLHGAKVGIGAILIAKRWQQIDELQFAEVEWRLGYAKKPDLQKEQELIRAAFPFNPEAIIKGQNQYLSMSKEDFAEFKEKILQNWDEIAEIAAAVPPPGQIAALLQKVSAPLNVTDIGLESQDEANALRYAHYLRSQFTISKLGRVLDSWE
jgi:glycerol-1-phosphate dehydrogenase [NAD(P)+]